MTIHWDIVATILVAVMLLEIREPLVKLAGAIVGLPFWAVAKALDAMEERRRRAQLRALELELARRVPPTSSPQPVRRYSNAP